MYHEINRDHLKALCIGCSFLGSGGGGDVNTLYEIVDKALYNYGPISMMNPNDLQDEDKVAAIEFVGAPLPIEMRQSNTQARIKPALDLVMQDLGIKINALMPVEIGGSNALVPLCIAGELNLPIVDCDLLGRALPEITMISTNIFDRMPSKAYICDPSTGQTQIITCKSYSELETQARAIASSYSNSAAILVPVVMTGMEVKQMAIHRTISQSIQIGLQDTLDGFCQATQGVIRCTGAITAWNYALKSGFLVGELMLQTLEGQHFCIKVKNEFLGLFDDRGATIAQAPDIITLLSKDSLLPILSDQLQIGDKVICMTCKGPDIWYTKKGLSLLVNIRA
jgi:DUF917 family protein